MGRPFRGRGSAVTNDQGLEVIFSLTNGDVWVSRHDGGPPTMIGCHDQVIEAMHDFIKQAEFAQRLMNRAAKGGDARA